MPLACSLSRSTKGFFDYVLRRLCSAKKLLARPYIASFTVVSGTAKVFVIRKPDG